MENAVGSFLPLIAKTAISAGVVAAVVATTAPAAALTAPKSLPHAAGYTVKIEAIGTAGSVVSGRGALQLQWQADCDGVAYSQTSLLTLNYSNGSSIDSEVAISSWEAADASSYRFFVKNGVNGQTTSKVDGKANRKPDGSLEVAYTAPNNQKLEMPAGIVFPLQQTQRLLRKANAGETHDWHQILRGEAEGDPAEVSVHIVPTAPEIPTGLGEGLADLLPAKGWRFHQRLF